MKIDRLIGILAALQQHGRVTAPYLAEKFEVSRRTINRDIEDICKAGIPIVTTRGKNGGIALMDGYRFDTTLFTHRELTAIFTGLRSLDSVARIPQAEMIAQKLGSAAPAGHMLVDLASFYKDDFAAKIDLLSAAIQQRRCVSFRYYYPKGEEDKCAEPCLVVYKWNNWYLYAFCRARRAYRLYRLRRMAALTLTNIPFVPHELDSNEINKRLGSNMTDDYHVTAIYDPAVKYRLVEEYGSSCFTVLPDGRLHTRWGFTTPQQALDWFLSFGAAVTVADPPEMVQAMRAAIEAMAKNYSQT